MLIPEAVDIKHVRPFAVVRESAEATEHWEGVVARHR